MNKKVLDHILDVLEYEDEERKAVKSAIGTMRRFLTLTKQTLLEAGGFSAGMVDEMMMVRRWYVIWHKDSQGAIGDAIEEVFTIEMWEEFVIAQNEEEFIMKEAARIVKQEESAAPATTTTMTTTTMTENTSGLNVSYKVETKEIPKLPPNKALKGKPFDEWQANFYVKMCQAKVGDLLEEGYEPPDESSDEYGLYKTKDNFLKNHLLTATMGSNAASFVNVKTMTGVEMYNKLRSIYQGQKHEEDTALSATTVWERLKFNRHSRYSPETFLSKVNECLKQMELEDANGTTRKAFSETMLPSLFRAKVDHHAFNLWKELSQNGNDDWETTQVNFLRAAEKHFGTNHDSSTKFRSANQKAQSGDQLTSKERKYYQKALKDGKRIYKELWSKLSDKEREALTKVKQEKWAERKAKKDGGLGSQYNANKQAIDLPKGTVLVPMTPQTPGMTTQSNNINAEMNTTGNNNSNSNEESPGNQTNQQRAVNFLQLANGHFIVGNTTFKLSNRVSDRMSVQSFKQQAKHKGTLWVDSGTNVSAMGRCFKMIEETGRFANMTGFANDLVKNDVPIGSGLTKCVDKKNGFEFLLGLHESPYLENNEGSLLSTNQSREAGIWLADVLRRHGGDQRLVAPVEGREEMLDIELDVKDGLLAIDCAYPTEKELRELPRVWLTDNEVPWDPAVLESEENITIPSCWDGESEFMVACDKNAQETEEINQFGEYIMHQQKATTFLVQTLSWITGGSFLYHTFNNVMEKAVSASSAVKKRDYEKYRPLLGWLPLEVVKRTFDCTTQLAMGSLLRLPFRQHHKSRTPQLNVPRLSETFATDTLFSSETALGGITCAQLFVGTKSKLTKIFGMHTESEGPEAFEDFIRENGAPHALRSDNAKMQTGESFKKILRKYNIRSENTEPHQPQQNPAERRIQDVKRLSTKILDRTGAPAYTWFFCMLYVVMVLNFSALESLGWITPHQACFGVTPDISALLQFRFYQPVFFSEKDVFPNAEERKGHWLGVAENKGDTLTYWVLAENKQVLARSLVRPMDENEMNKRTKEAEEIHDPVVEEVEGSQNDSKQANNEQLPSLDLLSDIVNSPTPVLDPSEINGFDASKHIGLEFVHKDSQQIPTKAKVIEVDDETGKIMLEYVHGGFELVEPNVIQEALLSKEYHDDGDDIWTFSKVLNHRTVSNGKIEVEILWDNGDVSWEPLAVMRKDDPVTLAGYAKERNLLEQRGWRWAKTLAKREKKFVRMLRIMKASKKKYMKKSFGKTKYKFGVEVPRTGDVRGAMALDKKNGDTLWFEAQKTEASTLRNMDTFELMPEGFDLDGYQYVPLIYAWDVKFDGRRRARLVANGKVTIGPPEEDVWSGVVNTDSVRTAMFLAMLNGMKILAADISSAYLMADTKEKMFTKLGPEFGDWAGKTALIRKALYGLIGSCAQFHRHLCAELAKLGFKPSRADPDLWMRDAGDHYEYIAKYIDDLLIIAKDPKAILDKLKKPVGPYEFKGVGSPEYYLGGDVKIVYEGNSISELWMSAKTYVKRICDKIKDLMDWDLKGYMNPMDPHYHAEVDGSDFLEGDEISKYRMMVGSLNWLVTLGRYDIHYTVCTLARHMMIPRKGHMMAMRRVFGYLKQNPNFSIEFDVTEPDFSMHKIEKYDWFPLYGSVQEEMPYGMPEPKGKPVVTSGFFDSSHASCLVTRRSTTCVILFLNGTPIRWYSKRQNCVETSTYGSEIVAGRIAVDLAVELRYNLRMLGAPVKGTTVLFGDNKSMITNTSLPHSVLKKRVSANNYHRVREAVASEIVSVVHCDTNYNLSDMGTKALVGPQHQFLLKNQKFPPVSSAGECQTDVSGSSTSTKAKLVLSILTPHDVDVAGALACSEFQRALCSE